MDITEEKNDKKMNPIVKVVLTSLSFILFAAIYLSIMLFLWANVDGFIGLIASVAVTTLAAGAETLVTRKLKIPQFILMLTTLLPIIALSLDLIFTFNTYYISDTLNALIIYLSIFAIRAFVAIINNFANKKTVITVMFIVVTVIFGTISTAMHVNFESLEQKILKHYEGSPDRTGSWNSINQEVRRDKNWHQIVQDSKFQLGDIKTIREAENDYDDYYCSLGTYPLIDGSTVCVPMGVEFARQHLGFDDDTSNDFINFSTTHYAYERLTDGETVEYSYWNNNNYINLMPQKVDIVIGTEPSDEELAMAKNAGVKLVKKPVCYDAFVFITHKDNPVESLTIEQIRDIYSGKIKNWKEVGGNDEKIVAYQREENSGSQTAMENLVMGGRDMIDPIKIKVIEGMGMLVDTVAEYDNKTASLGYTYRYYIDTLYKNDNIKTIAIDSVAPTDENIRNEKYPFTTNYYGVIRHSDENKTGGKFLDWMLTDEGQQCIAQAGYITMK